ncbi:tetratricopeptide repeat protein [Chryseobacterium indoltheticum]|uniref:tetratricopeptide repeat protein n=1 Tax=Chryseobacterium indoltheticum TaxID=254 RepID=UPI003F49B00D
MGNIISTEKITKKPLKGSITMLAINSSAVGVYASKAACYEALNQYQKAIEVYEEMLELEYTKHLLFIKLDRAIKL